MDPDRSKRSAVMVIGWQHDYRDLEHCMVLMGPTRAVVLGVEDLEIGVKRRQLIDLQRTS